MESNKQMVIAMYHNGRTVSWIADYYSTSQDTIREILEDVGLLGEENSKDAEGAECAETIEAAEQLVGWTVAAPLEDLERQLISEGTKEYRYDVLMDAMKLTSTVRQNTYGNLYDNMKTQGELKRILLEAGLGRYSDAHNTAIDYLLGKLVRIASGVLHRDNYVDGVNYLSEAYEAEVNEIARQKKG